MREILNRIKSSVCKAYIGEIGTFIIAWIILFDVVGGTMIPIAYGKGCGWFCIPNLIIDLYVVRLFIKTIKK